MLTKVPATVLIIDDDEDVLASLSLYLKLHFTEVFTSGTPSRINEIFSGNQINLVLLDMNFRQGINDGREGLYWLKHIKELKPDVPVVLLTAYGSIALAVESLKCGATDFLVKPWNNQKLLQTLLRAFELNKSKQAFGDPERQKKGKAPAQSDENQVEPRSPKMVEVMRIAQKVAATEANILILGENGTGKEVMARYIHENSPRAQQPLVTLDLGSVNENLFEAELFGYKKGAFTDAKEDKAGRFELAQGGTLFLDEIGNIPLSLQSKLLTAIQSKSFTPVGSTASVYIDCRIVCATNLDLHQAVREGSFRQDLLFRINTIEIELPPLRHRKEDIPELSRYFLRKFNKRYQKQTDFDNEVLDTMQNYSWPGNIRELQHVIERSVIMADDQRISPHDLQLSTPVPVLDDDNEELDLEELEKRHIARVLRKFEGNISHAAKALKINRNTLYRKIEKYGL